MIFYLTIAVRSLIFSLKYNRLDCLLIFNKKLLLTKNSKPQFRQFFFIYKLNINANRKTKARSKFAYYVLNLIKGSENISK